jgi:2-(1,2-epoxy-1,2-dihydrophenyl)acetyl-CoA isomerase
MSITTITLDRPELRNAFDAALAARLADDVQRAADDTSCRVIVLTGAGRSFCAGADLRQLKAILAARDQEQGRALVSSGNSLVHAIVAAPKPVIAAVNGAAAGGGASIALACDVRIASSDASIGAVFGRIGLHPDLGATYFLPHLAGFGRAMELVLSAEMISATEAHRIGIFNRVVSGDALMTETYELARTLAARPALALARAKRSMHATIGMPLDAVMALELDEQLALMQTDEARDALRAFLKRSSAN